MKKNVLALAVLASLTLSACGGGSSSSDTSSIEVTSSAPTAISLSNESVDENTLGAVIGTLSATDSDSGDTFTFSTDSDMFTITGTTLSLNEDTVVDYESNETITANITVTDSNNLSFTEEKTISVNDILDVYAFESKFTTGESSVNYTGQTYRHVLIAELNTYISSGLQADIDDGTVTSKQDVLDTLELYFDLEEGHDSLAITFLENAEQQFVTELASARDLLGKLAGNDASRSNVDWNSDNNFVGAGDGFTPTTLVRDYFDQLADNAVEAISGNIRRDEATNEEITQVYINTNGTDLKQLIQKFLLMGVTYSQGTDDYLDEGLDSDNIDARNDNLIDTALEHGYDEGFGYFGAASNYLEYTDEQNANASDNFDLFDKNDDDLLDLTSEVNLGNSVNAAKRDLGSADNANPTDFTTDAMTAFLAGRQIINDNVGQEFTTEQKAELEAQRDIAVGAWEKAIAATVIHYINDLTNDLNQTDDYSFEDVAKHFSEMKGFALGLQFNPHSDLTSEQFAQLHTYFGTAPVTPVFGSDDRTDVDAYLANLQLARDLLQDVLEFDADNVANW